MPHLSQFRVYYEDTDVGGVVYYANYLKFAERARTELLRASHISQAQLWREDSIAFVVKTVAMDCIRPARLDDLLTIATHVADIGSVSVHMQQRIDCEETRIADISVKLGVVGADFRPSRKLPENVRKALAEYLIL